MVPRLQIAQPAHPETDLRLGTEDKGAGPDVRQEEWQQQEVLEQIKVENEEEQLGWHSVKSLSNILNKFQSAINHIYNKKPSSDTNNTLLDQKLYNSSCNTKRRQNDELEKAPFLTTLGTYFAYVVLYLVGTLRELLWGTGPLNGNSEAFRDRPHLFNFDSIFR